MITVKWSDDPKEYQRQYALINKDKISSRKKAHYINNIDNKKEYDSNRYLSEKHKPTVYLLVNDNYVGTTENLNKRLSHHKANGRDTSIVRTIKVLDDRQEALELEALMHTIGYKGIHLKKSYK
jgi:hypothetical protein